MFGGVVPPRSETFSLLDRCLSLSLSRFSLRDSRTAWASVAMALPREKPLPLMRYRGIVPDRSVIRRICYMYIKVTLQQQQQQQQQQRF